MTVLVAIRIPVDTDAFRRFVAANPDKLREIAEEERSNGALHHRFAIGDGEIFVLDEWESGEHFLQFFEGNPSIEAVMSEVGASGEPDVRCYEAIETARF